MPTPSSTSGIRFPVSRFELLYEKRYQSLLERVASDIRKVSPETEVAPHPIELDDPWEFEEVYGALHDFARGYDFRPEEEDYLVHITTGSHVMRICLFLLTESRHFPGKLVQGAPRRVGGEDDGVAKRDITPEKPVTLAGYSSRKDLSKGAHDPLSARVTAWEAVRSEPPAKRAEHHTYGSYFVAFRGPEEQYVGGWVDTSGAALALRLYTTC